MLRNLLIVEDNASMRRLIRTIVEDLAENIHECDDGAGALSAYSSVMPEVVLMDIEMTNTDGLTATREIVGVYPDAEVIILTKYESPRIRREAELSGARNFVLKENLLDIRRLINC